ncbi:hypothetical protein DVR09_15095 (plasmid) [Erythrobacter aureus]|uniref:Uncharacterized protein n=1 Tax=Erythrobacter aureus TaxID=2182384 RepID=A0A345YIM8_9SPHN|nr:hypothetical protein DVR09_15095 [Erythrobacter aureus]
MPPPCIVADPGKIAGTVAEIAQKKKELEAAIEQVKQYTDLNNALGKIGSLAPELTSAITPSQTGGFAPLSSGPRVSVSEASNAFDASLRGQGTAEAARGNRLRLRSAAGEGFAMAMATKNKLSRMNAEAERLTKLMQGVGSNSADMRTAWSINQGAKRLLFDAMMAKREVEAARMQLNAVHALPTHVSGGRTSPRTEAPAVASVEMGEYAEDIGKLANAAAKLAALLNAKNIVTGFTAGIEGSRQTQLEYSQMQAAARQAQQSVQAIAASDARKKGIAASRLIGTADSYMARYDRTTWDNPNKGKSARDAAAAAENAMDKMVRGDVNDNWSDRLIRRAEAYKQEAFFRPIAQDAANMERQTREALAEYEQSIGVDASDSRALAAAIAQAQAEVDALYRKLASAPPAIVRKRDQILAASGIDAARNLPEFVYPVPVIQPPTPTPTPNPRDPRGPGVEDTR